MNPHHLRLNRPTSLKYRFAKGFLRALIKINRRRIPTSCSPKEIFQRYHRVKTAADKSLAYAVGSRRPWSRAMLSKFRNQAWRRHALLRRNNHHALRKRGLREKVSGHDDEVEQVIGFDQVNDLRKLVPGGEAMNLCRLLEEAADYIKCLNTQVQVMGSIADLYST